MRALFVVALISGTAFAEAGWLGARGRLLPELRVEGWGGTDSAGGGFVLPDSVGRPLDRLGASSDRPDGERALRPDGPHPDLSEPVPSLSRDGRTRAATTAELAYHWRNRTLELRGARLWQLTPTRLGTVSATVGGAAHIVPEGRFDAGLGPHAGLTLSLGGSVCTVDLSLLTGAELFLAPVLVRFPQRAQLSLNFVIGSVLLGLHARMGADFVTGLPWVGRGELALSFGWLFARSPPSSGP